MRIADLFRKTPPFASLPALEDFFDSRTAFMVQKCVFEYARARSGLLSSKLFKEAAFMSALNAARWRNYPLCLECVAVMSEHALRPHAGEDGPALRSGIAAAAANVTNRYPIPPGLPAEFWAQARERIAHRIDMAGLAAPHPVKDLPNAIAKEFFANLPIHESLRGHDFVLVTNNLRVNLCRAYEDLLAQADLPRLAEAVMAGPPAVALPGQRRRSG
ncbi:hypothetical protein ACUN0C_00480 [Faunimonas sp. B44]|uniref:hypothetical protein n=1 Tax=Faunimonas sp. B44 TaxID=3461493 RepID=UPI004044C951